MFPDQLTANRPDRPEMDTGQHWLLHQKIENSFTSFTIFVIRKSHKHLMFFNDRMLVTKQKKKQLKLELLPKKNSVYMD